MVDRQKPKDRTFRNDGVNLHYVEWGDPSRETLIFIHGIRDQCRSWDFLVAALGASGFPSRHLVALDLRGHGDSDWAQSTRGYQHEDYLFDLVALIRHLNKQKITLIGHSLGGSMAVLYAGSFPEMLEALVLVESVGPFARADDEIPRVLGARLLGTEETEPSFPYLSLEDTAKRVKEKFPLIPDQACAHMALHGSKKTAQGRLWKYDPRMRNRSHTMLSEPQIQAFIRRIRCPTLLVYGTESELTRSARGARLPLFSSAKLVAIEGAGHHIPHEKPDDLARIIASFLLPD